ncbi:MAG: FAD-binding oxidoreductase, partial [Desulfurella sp.]
MQALILSNDKVANDIYCVKLQKSHWFDYKPGKFLMLKVNNLNEPLLRRPFSIAEAVNSSIDIYYKVVGLGTNILSDLKKGEFIDFTGPFGNSFEIKHKRLALVGGGIGVAPLIGLKNFLDEQKIESECFFGFNTANDCFVDFGHIVTIDGSSGIKGTVVDMLAHLDNSYHVYACGP